MKKSLIAAALAAISLAPGVALAQDAAAATTAAPPTATPTAGAKVFDTQGNDVGTIETVQGDIVTVSTGTVRAGLPASAFVTREKGLTIGMTKADLEAAVQGAKAETSSAKEAAIVADAPIKSSDGIVLGTISKVDGENVTLTLSDGSSAALKKSYLGLDASGALALGMTAADFNKATKSAPETAAAPAASPASAQ